MATVLENPERASDRNMTLMTNSFDPARAEARNFRDALGRYGTGVTVVTCATDRGPLGMTANSFASLSLDPPLVLWSPAKSSSRYPFFMAAEHFAIHVLSSTQAPLCEAFSKSGDAFAGLDWHTSENGVPLIDGCLSRFDCKQTAAYDGGDHSILVGHVMRVTLGEGEPLMFHGGRLGRFAQG